MSRRVGFGNSPAAAPRARGGLWDRQLVEGEEILWEGRPGFGFKLSVSALKTLVIVGIGIAIIGPQMLAIDRMGHSMGNLLDLPVIGGINGRLFLALAAGWTFIWFLMQTTTTPFFTHYMLTNNRAFIAKTLLWKRIKSYELTPFRAVEYDGRRDGSILFATEVRRADNGRKRDFPIGFMHVRDAETVYKKMVEIQRSKIGD